MNIPNIRNCSRALRESPNPYEFDMSTYVHSHRPLGAQHTCYTPACVFGHYVARPDLQSAFKLSDTGFIKPTHPNIGGWDGLCVTHLDPITLIHFGITSLQAAQLFGDRAHAYEYLRDGLGREDFLVFNAHTNIEAADWIDRFCDRHEQLAQAAELAKTIP